jgi:hypothetical protein
MVHIAANVDGWTDVNLPSVEMDPPKALSAIRQTIWRLREGKARVEMERVSANIHGGENAILVRDDNNRVVGAAAHIHVGGARWLSNLAATGEVAGTGTALLRAVARVAMAHEGLLALCPLDEEAERFFVSRGGDLQLGERGAKTIVWAGEALRTLTGLSQSESELLLMVRLGGRRASRRKLLSPSSSTTDA